MKLSNILLTVFLIAEFIYLILLLTNNIVPTLKGISVSVSLIWMWIILDSIDIKK